jgi:hypothetical protein
MNDFSLERPRSMKKRPHAILLALSTLLLAALCSGCGQEAETPATAKVLSQQELGSYSHGIAVGDLHFLWTLKGDNIDVKLAAPTKGWIGVGFNPDTPENMKGANFLIGYVKGGEAEVFDHYGTETKKHKEDEKIEGSSDLSNVSGSEQDGQTVLEFTVPLDSGDAKDKPVSPQGETVVLLAYGRSDSVVLKHRFRAAVKVNLSTGENSVLRME